MLFSPTEVSKMQMRRMQKQVPQYQLLLSCQKQQGKRPTAVRPNRVAPVSVQSDVGKNQGNCSTFTPAKMCSHQVFIAQQHCSGEEGTFIKCCTKYFIRLNSCTQKPNKKDCRVTNNRISWEESTPVIAAKAANYRGLSYTEGSDNSAKVASCLFPFQL